MDYPHHHANYDKYKLNKRLSCAIVSLVLWPPSLPHPLSKSEAAWSDDVKLN